MQMYESSPEIKFQRIEGTFGESQEEAGAGLDFGTIKKWIVIVVLIAIIGGAGYFAYQYFIGSLKEIEFSVKNTENEAIGDVGIRIYESEKDTPLSELSEGALIKLRYGKYRYEAAAPEYRADSGYFDVDAESPGSVEIILKKDIRVELQLDNFPEQLVTGQTDIELPLIIKNSAAAPAEVELVLEGALKELQAKMSPESLSVAGQGTSSSILSISVPATIAVKDQKKGDAKKGSIRVKYTSSKADVSFTLFKKPELKLSPTQIDFGKLKAGVIGQGASIKTITIKNSSSAFAVGAVGKEIEITSMQQNANSEEDVLDWFSWSADIDAIEPEKSASANLIVNVPVEALSDLISGNVVFSTGYWEARIPLKLEVVGAEIVLSISATNSGKVSLEKLAAGNYESKDVKLTLKNNSSVALEDFAIVNPIDEGCSGAWIDDIGKNIIDLLAAKGGSEEIIVTVSAPINAPIDEAQKCPIRVIYTAPTGERESQDFVLSITPTD